MIEYVYPTSVMVVRYRGGRIHLKPDQRWEANDPFVKERPELFRTDSVHTAHSPGYTPEVEQATRAPGERRATKRAAKKPGAGTE